MKYITYCVVGIFLSCILLSSCATSTATRAFETEQSQVQIRSIQTRAFDTTDKGLMMRAVISSMQDLEFVLEQADLSIGTVTGSKFTHNNEVNMTVTIRPRGETQLLVRANAQYGTLTIEDPLEYQNFFTLLEKSLFLTAHNVD